MFVGTDDELNQTITAWRRAAREYRRLAKLPRGHRERGGSDTIPLLQAAEQANSMAKSLHDEACLRDLIASGGIANAP